MRTSPRFPRGGVATPHHLATTAGVEVLAAGGNAVDAAVAANLVLGVVAPYTCGPGGDLFALVADPDGRVHGLASNGRAPAGATLETVRAALDVAPGAIRASATPDGTDAPTHVPFLGALPVVVPGAVAGWQALLDRHGTRTFGDLAGAAVRLAEDGFEVSPAAADVFSGAAARYAAVPHFDAAFGHVRARTWLVQPGHAAFLRALAEDGPALLHGGRVGQELVEVVAAGGSTMTLQDLRDHEFVDVTPLSGMVGDIEVLELPPPTQGVTALQAFGVAERLRQAHGDDDPARWAHLQVEAVRGALVDRDAHVADPDAMRTTPTRLLDHARLDAVAAAVDPDRAAGWPPVPPAPGGTAYLCAADADGMVVSVIASNFTGFGSGLVLPLSGISLQNRGAQLRLDPGHVNAVAPRRRPLHTLVPTLVRRGASRWGAFGTMGGDGQPQTHLQVLDRIARGADPQAAISAPRWVVSAHDGSVAIEDRADADVVDGLRRRGHAVHVLGGYEAQLGHAHALLPSAAGGWVGASDPRTEGAVLGR